MYLFIFLGFISIVTFTKLIVQSHKKKKIEKIKYVLLNIHYLSIYNSILKT